MLKAQKWKSTKILLILLLFGAFFEACRQKDVLPEHDKGRIVANIKTWYNQKTQPTSHNKSLQSATWYPQWNEPHITRLDAQTRLVIFPVWRYARVTYYEIGFVRRLAFRINEQDEVIDGEMLHMVSSKNYLQQHKNSLPHRYYLNNRSVPVDDAMIRTYPITGWDIRQNKSFCEATEEYYSFDQPNCVVHYSNNCGDAYDYVVVGCVTSVLNQGDLGGGGGPSNPSDSPPWYYDPGAGGGGPGSGESEPIFTEDPPCPNCPVDGLDPGDNTNQEPPRKITLDSTFQNNNKATCIYDRIKKMVENGSNTPHDNLFWRMTKPFSGANAPRLEIVLADSSVTGKFTGGLTVDKIATENKVTVNINKQLLSNMSDIVYANTILHELIHAYFIAKIHEMGETIFYQCLEYNQNCPPAMANSPYKEFKATYNFIQIPNYDELEHEVMANDTYDYRKDLIKALKAFMAENASSLSNDMYSAISWIGLGNTIIYNNPNIISEETDKAIKKLMEAAIMPSQLDKCN